LTNRTGCVIIEIERQIKKEDVRMKELKEFSFVLLASCNDEGEIANTVIVTPAEIPVEILVSTYRNILHTFEVKHDMPVSKAKMFVKLKPEDPIEINKIVDVTITIMLNTKGIVRTMVRRDHSNQVISDIVTRALYDIDRSGFPSRSQMAYSRLFGKEISIETMGKILRGEAVSQEEIQ
jgi:hypothetical protein